MSLDACTQCDYKYYGLSPDAAVKRAILERQEEYIRLWNKGDADGVASLYTKGAIFMPPRALPDFVGKLFT